MATVSGQIVTRTGKYREQIWGGWFFMTLSTGLMIMLDDRSNQLRRFLPFCHRVYTEFFHSVRAEKVLYLLLGALGAGPLFQVSFQS